MSNMSEPVILAPTAPARPTFTRATVCSGLVETAYGRAGRGDTVVALAARDWRGAASLFPALARDFRLIVPELDDTGAEFGRRPAFAEWLSAFLDGLGVGKVTLVADERFGAAALGSALIEPLRVARLVVVLDAAASERPLDTTDATLSSSGTKLVVAWLGTNDDAVANEISAALLGEGRPSG